MTDAEFSDLIRDANEFFVKLKANNTRDWFHTNKLEYEKSVKQPGQLLLDDLAIKIERIIGTPPNKKMFRINRDVRFSKDKTPYNTHLHLIWTVGTGPGFFFGASPEYVTAGCGVMGLQKERLDAYRKLVDAEGEAIAKELSSLKAKGYRLEDAELKRVPAPYDKEHPQASLLKRKSLALWCDLEPTELSFSKVIECFDTLLPLYRFCQKI